MSRLPFSFYKIRIKWEYIYVILYIFWENYDMILVKLIEKVSTKIMWNLKVIIDIVIAMVALDKLHNLFLHEFWKWLEWLAK